MQTWATLAAKHATLTSGIGLGAIPVMGWDSLDGVAVGALLAGVGFAVVNSPRRVRSCQLPLDMSGRTGRVQTSRPATARLSRVRQRVDGLLTGMLSDDSDRMTPAPPAWQGDTAAENSAVLAAWPAMAAEPMMPAPVATFGAAEAEAEAEVSDQTTEPPAARRGKDAEQETSVLLPDPGERKSDDGFWGPGESAGAAPTSGYQSKHRLDGAAKDARLPHESRRSMPRHAAPPASFGATIGRRLSSPRLTSRSAAHAGG